MSGNKRRKDAHIALERVYPFISELMKCSFTFVHIGYLACARCSASGVVLSAKPISLISVDSNQPLRLPTSERCTNCSGAGKVMCPACLCTGMIMASEHDPRIDPFD